MLTQVTCNFFTVLIMWQKQRTKDFGLMLYTSLGPVDTLALQIHSVPPLHCTGAHQGLHHSRIMWYLVPKVHWGIDSCFAKVHTLSYFKVSQVFQRAGMDLEFAMIFKTFWFCVSSCEKFSNLWFHACFTTVMLNSSIPLGLYFQFQDMA